MKPQQIHTHQTHCQPHPLCYLTRTLGSNCIKDFCSRAHPETLAPFPQLVLLPVLQMPAAVTAPPGHSSSLLKQEEQPSQVHTLHKVCPVRTLGPRFISLFAHLSA